MYITGIDVGTPTSDAQHRLGSIGWNADSAGDKAYMYVQADASGITADGYVVLIDGSSFSADMAETTASAPATGFGKAVGVARAAFTASYYGWVQVYGPGVVRVSANAAAYTQLNTTATAGQLDDDATAGAEVISGVALDATTGGAAATTAGFLQWPAVARTL